MADADLVADYYNEPAFAYESVRLTEHSPVEFAITKRYLDRWIPPCARVAEIGVGVGHYSEHLARRGCRVHLVDVSQRLLDSAAKRLREAGLERQVDGVSRLSATDLSPFDSGVFDAVLALGPLYHLRNREERQQAAAEAARVLKPAGIAYAAGINRLAYLRDLFRNSVSGSAVERRAFHEQYLRDGNLDPEHAPPIGFAHLTTITEFRALFYGVLEELALAGTESFTVAEQSRLNAMSREEKEAWLDLVEQTAESPEGLGQADHFLFVGRKPQRCD